MDKCINCMNFGILEKDNGIEIKNWCNVLKVVIDSNKKPTCNKDYRHSESYKSYLFLFGKLENMTTLDFFLK